MARNASGTYTLPASNPVAAGTVITTTWANPTLEDVADSLTASLDRNGQGGMLVGLKGFAGTNSLPGFTFADEVTSGLYRAGAADIRFSIGTLDATRWVDDSGTASGSQQPFQIWDGGAWQDIYYDGSALFGTGVAAALALNIGAAGAVTLFNGDLGTPSALVLTNATGTVTNLDLVTPALGTPTALVATNATGTATGLTSGLTAALKSATTTVNVASSAAPTAGQVLTATGASAATWQDGAGGLTLGTAVATTSGSEVDFTSFPSGTKRITINLDQVSYSSTQNFDVYLGDSGGFETSGYSATGSIITTTVNSTGATDNFPIRVANATAAVSGTMVLTLIDASTNTWSAFGVFNSRLGATATYTTAGSKSLSGELTQVRFTFFSSGSFDNGKINITYE